MNLLNKISIWFIAIVLLVTPLSMYISYTNIQKRLDNVEIERLRSVNNYVAAQLKRGETPEKTSQGLPISIKPYAGSGIIPTNPEIIHTCLDNNGATRNECKIQINTFVTAANKTYKISSYSYITSTEQIMKGMLSALLLKVLLITAIVFITARVLSRYILKPFHHAIDNIHQFNIQKREPLQLLSTSTNEFKKLNEFLRLMTDKAIEDYTSVKEFSENASHEVQTPLAIIQSKIELLAETEIDGKQAALLTDIQNSIDKLSRINRSLILLTKLNNYEFLTNEKLKFCKVEKEAINTYSDHIALKNITLNRHCEKEVFIKIHPALAEILLNNLLSNAIRHNVKNGNIEILLTHQFFQISNTGLPPDTPTHELFKRFKKSNQSTESIGLGLSIVKQICEVNAFPVHYDFNGGWHCITVYFDKTESHKTFVPSTNYKNSIAETESIQPAFNFAE